MPHNSIACVYIPRFAVEAERRRRKDTSSRLLLIGAGTVFDCSLGAEASKVRRGMRMSEAIGLCHRALVLPTDMPYYERLFDEVLEGLEDLSPDVQAGELGTVFVALDGLPTRPRVLADEIISVLHRRLGLMASIGVGSGKFVARVAAAVSRPGVAKVISPGEEATFLAPLSVEHLPASEAMRWRLQVLGIETIGGIARLPIGPFQAQFGPEGKRCWDLAHGTDGEPLLPRMREEAIVRRLQMPAPSASLDAILVGVERLIRAAYGSNERGGRWVRKVLVRASLDGGGTWELAVPFREALANPGDAWIAVKAAVTRKPPERPVEEIEAELVGLTRESGKQAAMFEGKSRLWHQVDEAVRQLGSQSGRPSLGKVVEVEPWSRIPERRTALADLMDS